MGSNLLELSRVNHEFIERHTRALCEELDDIPKNYKDSTAQLHRANHHLTSIMSAAKSLIEVYEDKDGLKKDEINAISGSGPNLYSTFYEKLRELREYHRRYPGLEPELPEDQVYVFDEQVVPQFTGEEAYGQCLDLHELFERYINLKDVEKIDYVSYLDTFYKFNDDRSCKKAEYKAYVKDLGNYLVDFIRRSQPLLEIDEEIKKIDNEFELMWTLKKFKGWKNEGITEEKMEIEEEPKDQISDRKDNEDREREEDRERDKDRDREKDRDRDRDRDRDDKERDRDRDRNRDRERDRDRDRKRDRDGGSKSSRSRKDKRERAREQEKSQEEERPVYCDACKKEFAKSTVYKAHLNGKKHKKAAGLLQGGVLTEKQKETYFLENKVHQLVTRLLLEQISATKNNIEKKQSKTWEEMKKEWEAERRAMIAVEQGEESESEEEPEIKLTIDNYPVGWDGKPIPYWLYKLHGLGVEYKCEICGNTSYWGRKAYEKHFQEWRHAHGMRCLGIPNSKHFHDITKINDALALWEKIKYDSAHGDWRPEADEEFEDKEGNVFNKKTYDDLRRQNLL